MEHLAIEEAEIGGERTNARHQGAAELQVVNRVKLILSRKGFDSSAGGYPSPILPDGRMLSLPIPSSLDNTAYSSLHLPEGISYADIIDQLDAGAKTCGKGAHLDPDLVARTRPRAPNWLPTLGQIGSAAGHLRKQHVSEGDLFLFYGWFRYTSTVAGRLQFEKKGKGFHAIFGYLRVGAIISADAEAHLPEWLNAHPHADPRRMAKATNTIYVAAGRSDGADRLGAAVFRFDRALQLTKPGLSRSRWNLDPTLFRHLEISYHTDSAWRDGYFQSYPRAQEYVVHADAQAIEWAYGLIDGTATWG